MSQAPTPPGQPSSMPAGPPPTLGAAFAPPTKTPGPDQSTRQAAWIAAVAALVAAVLTVGGTLWGAYRSSESADRAARTAAEAAVRAVEVQLSGETDKSRAEFLRGQRQVLYTTIAKHMNVLVDAEIAYWAFLDVGPTGEDFDHERAHELFEKMYAALNQLEGDTFSIFLASPEVARDLNTVLKSHNEVYHGLLAYKKYKAGEAGEPTFDYGTHSQELVKLEAQLLEGFRSDMGNR